MGGFATTPDRPGGYVKLKTTDIPPPSPYYVNSDDVLLVGVHNEQATLAPVQVALRLLLPNGVISSITRELAVISAGATFFFPIDLAEGYLLSVQLSSAGASFPGEIYARAHLARRGAGALGFTFYGTLCAGYCYQSFGPAWPVTDREVGLPEAAFIRSVTGTDPAAGVEISETFNNPIELLGVRFSLVCSATVATRQVHLLIDDGANVLFDRLAEVDVAATQTGVFNCAPVGFGGRVLADTITIELPHHMFLQIGDRIRTSTLNLQAGDNFSAPQMWFKQWIYT